MKKGIKKLFAMLCAALCLFGTSACGGGTTNSNGNDNSGGEVKVELYKNPYKITVATDGTGDYDNLPAALEQVKTLQNDTGITGSYDAILIALSSGKHLISEEITIDADIAAGNIPVVIEGSANGETVLDGGVEIKGGWSVYDSEKGIYKTPVSGLKPFRQLYIDDTVGIRARYPNDTGVLTNDHMPLTWNEDKTTRDTLGAVAIPSYVQYDFSFDALKGAELHFVQEWTQSVGHIWDKDINEQDELLYFGFEEDWFTKQLFKREQPIRNGATNKCWLENSLEFLDAENEWYYDEANETLYYKPADGADIQSMTFAIPQTESIIKIVGTPEKAAKKVALSRLTVCNTNWSYVSEHGYIDGQAGLFYGEGSATFDQKSPSAGIYSLYAHDITVNKCHVKNMGAYGVDFHVGTKNAMLVNSTVEKTAGSGVNIGCYGETMPEGYVSNAATPTTEEEITEEIAVKNCLIQEIGTSFKGGSTGIVAGFARKLTLEQNTITNVSYSGIAVGWGWEMKNTVLCNVKINNNHITNVMNHLPFDGGPIYLLGKHVVTLEGSQIQGNYIEASGLAGIYFDNSSSAYQVKNNVIKGEGLKGIVDLHDWNYLLSDLSVTNTYSNLQYPQLGIYHHNYWSNWPNAVNPPPTTASRGVYWEDEIYAYEGGKWSAEAQAIIDKAGQNK
ncbi:MAG: right-handed parallel beta-helix repeat-containing protein [Clostridia bacterium]|nr:right-handed parallel beta-helix repeat-containing protein [Clostridia bacterium]